MTFTEINMDLFSVSNDYYFAHCISADCAMGAGIAVLFQRKFHLSEELLKFSEDERKYPTCIRIGRVYNLITKDRYFNKPTYDTVRQALLKMKEQAVRDGIKKIAMPKIASGLDQLSWNKVREIIKETFQNTDIDILICYL